MPAPFRFRLPAGTRAFVLGGLASFAYPLSALVSSPILARGLGPDGRGELAALLTPLTVAEAIAAVGTPLAAAYFVRSGARLDSVRRGGLRIVTVSGIAAAALLMTVAPSLLGRYPELVPAFRWLSLSIVASGYIELYRGMRSGQQAYGRVNANYWLAALARLAGIVALAMAGALTPTRVAVLSIAVGLVAGLTLIRLPRRASEPAEFGGPDVRTSRMVRFSLRTWAGVVSGSIGSRLDQFILIGFLTPEVLGVYAVAATAAQVPMAFFPAVQRLLVNRAAARHDAAGLTRASQLSAGVAVATVVALVPVMPWVIRTAFGPAFAEAGPLARTLLVGAALWGIGQSLGGLLIGVGLPGSASAADAVGVLLLGVGLVPLYTVLGIEGAALAVVLSSAVTTVLKARFLARARDVRTLTLLLPSPRAFRDAFTAPVTTPGNAHV